MKIAYLVGNFPVLSETFISNEVILLSKLGVSIQVFSFKKPSESDYEKFSKNTYDLINKTIYISNRKALLYAVLHPLKFIKGYSENKKIQSVVLGRPKGYLRLFRAIALIQLIKSHNCNCLHAHWPYASQVAHLINTIEKIPYSISIHAHEVAHENQHFPIVFKTLRFASFCNAGAMGYLKELLKGQYLDKIHLIYHGVDIDSFTPLPVKNTNDNLTVISAGRLTSTKGFDRLIRACAYVRENNINIRLIILGRGQLELELKELANSVNFNEFLEMPGWIPQNEVKEYMKKAHVFALLADTGFHDGLPNVALEAMSCKRPVILSPLPAASELITHGKEGFILKAIDDYEGFLSAVKSILATPESLEIMANASRERVKRDHDAHSQIMIMKSLFESTFS